MSRLCQDENDSDNTLPEADMESVADVSANNEESASQESVGVAPTERYKKQAKSRNASKTDQPPMEMKSVVEITSAATKVLNNICQKQSDKQDSHEDKDKAFCSHLYFKLQAIPDGDAKDELQVEILQLICRYKRACANAASSQQLSRTSTHGMLNSNETSWQPQCTQPWQWLPSGQGWHNQLSSGFVSGPGPSYGSASGSALQLHSQQPSAQQTMQNVVNADSGNMSQYTSL